MLKGCIQFDEKSLLLTRTHQSTERQWLASKYQQLFSARKKIIILHTWPSESEWKSTNVKRSKTNLLRKF